MSPVLSGDRDRRGISTAPWTPANLGVSLVSWLKADAIVGKNDGDAISGWADSSGNGKDATNATGAEQPLYKTSVVNGLPVVRFDGVDDDLTITAPGLSKPCTVAFVARLTNAAPPSAARLYSQSSPLIVRTSGTDYQMLGNLALNYHTGLDTNPHSHVLSFDSGASSRGCFDGTAVTGNAGSTALGGNAVIASASASNWIAVDIPEIVLINGAVASGNLDRIDGYLAWKYGLQDNLPAGHPYKSAAPVG